MQQLYDTVRATGAQNLVIIGGLNWAYDLSGVPAQPDRRLQHRLRDPPLQPPDGHGRRRTGTRLGDS